MDPFEGYMDLSQLDKLYQGIKKEKNSNSLFQGLWIKSQSRELSVDGTGKLDDHNWKIIELDSKQKKQFRKCYKLLKENIDPNGTGAVYLNYDGHNMNLSRYDLLDESRSVFGKKYAEKLKNSCKINKLPEEIYKIAKNLLEGVEPLKEEQILRIYDLLGKTAGSAEVYKLYSQLNDSIQAIRLDKKSGMIAISANEEGEDASKGVNTSYFLNDLDGKKSWVFKPKEGENHTLNGIPEGGGAKREQIAYLVNQKKYPIPFTTYVELNKQVGSVQLYIDNCITLSKIRTSMRGELNKIDTKDLQFIMLFDLYYSNCDGHMSNILCRPILEGKRYEIFSIDHGGSMSNSLKDPLFLDYLHLKQICFTKFDKDVINFINIQDNNKNSEILQKHGITGLPVDWYNFVSNCLTYVVNHHAEILPAEIAWLLVKERNVLMESNEKEVLFKKMVSDLINIKKKINNFVDNGLLNQKNFQMTMDLMRKELSGKYGLQMGNQWTNVLFKNIFKNYYRILTSDESFLDYLGNL